MTTDFRLLMLGAMYENGGNTTHRFLDGHPELFVYPFESQIGTRLVNDLLSSTFPVKYRWPVFALDATPQQDYRAIIDEEGKVRARTPKVSKFRDYPFDFSDDERMEIYARYVAETGRSRANNVAAFFARPSRLEGLHADRSREGLRRIQPHHCRRCGPDRRGRAGCARAARRAKPMVCVCRHEEATGSSAAARLPARLDAQPALRIALEGATPGSRPHRPSRGRHERLERSAGTDVDALGIELADSLKRPSWNARPLEQVYPWGTIRTPTPAANHATALELSREEQDEVRRRAWQYLDVFGYSNFLEDGAVGPLRLETEATASR